MSALSDATAALDAAVANALAKIASVDALNQQVTDLTAANAALQAEIDAATAAVQNDTAQLA